MFGGGTGLVLALVVLGYVLVALLPVGRWLDHHWDAHYRRPDLHQRASHERLMAELRRHVDEDRE